MLGLLIGLGIYLLLCLAIAWVGVKPPRTPSMCSPGAFEAPQEDVKIPSPSGADLSAWWVPDQDSNSVAILCHGYFLSKGELAPVGYMLWQQGMSCLLFDFPAHGKTEGGTCFLGTREGRDVLAAVRWVRDRQPDAKIVLIGSSMGSVASAFAFAEQPNQIQALVLDSAYNKVSDAVLGWWRFLGGWPLATILSPTVIFGIPFLRLNPFKARVTDALSKLRGKPILVMHGDQDPLATPTQAERNIRALDPETEVVWFRGCGHSEGRWEQPDLYRLHLLRFLRKHGFLT